MKSLRDGGRVLIVTPQPFYEDRGTPIAVRYVAQALSELGAKVDLLAYPVGQDVKLRNVRVIRCANPLNLRNVPISFSAKKTRTRCNLAAGVCKIVALWPLRHRSRGGRGCLHGLALVSAGLNAVHL
jgi:hypothetical protein